MARLTEEICPWCGESFTKNIHNQKWCSPACKNKAYRQRKKQGKVNSRAIDVERGLAAGTVFDRPWNEIIYLDRPPSIVVKILDEKSKREREQKQSIEVDKQEEEIKVDPELVKQFGDFLAKKIKPQADSEA